MNSSRRAFIKTSGVAAVGIFGLKTTGFGQTKTFSTGLPNAVDADAMFHYDAEIFRQLIGAEFSLPNATDASAKAVLTAVKESKTDKLSRQKSANCFTLSFKTNASQTQETYTVFHPQLGTFDLFLVPGKTEKGGYLLHAVINRI